MGSSSAPPPPPTPDYQKATREGILADIETLPIRRLVERSAMMGQSGGFSLDGKNYSFNFRGSGDADLAREQAKINKENAFTTAQDLLEVQDRFGARFISQARDQLRMSDPIGFALRETAGKLAMDELNLGGRLSDSQLRTVTQSTRAGQTARGNSFGTGAALEEVLASDQYSKAVQQQRFGNALAFSSGQQPVNQFGALAGAQNQATPFIGTNVRGIGLDPNSTSASANFALQGYSAQMAGYNAQVAAAASRGNPWMQGLGMAVGLAGTLGGAAIAGPVGAGAGGMGGRMLASNLFTDF